MGYDFEMGGGVDTLLVTDYVLVNFVSSFELELMYVSHIRSLISIRSSLTHKQVSGACAAAIVQRNHFCHLHQKDKQQKKDKYKFRQASNHCKRVLQAARIAYANKTESIASQKLDSQDFGQIASSVLNKNKSAISPLFNVPEVFSSASAKFFAENSSNNSNFDDPGTSVPVFPSRTNLKLHKTSVTPKMVKNVIMNLDL